MAVTGAVLAVESSMWAATACMHVVHALHELFHPLCGMLVTIVLTLIAGCVHYA